MKCSETPQLVGEPYGSWHASIGRGKDAYNQYFDKITFSINGRIIPTTPLFPNPFIFDPGSFKKENPDGHIRNLIMIKKDNWAKGYFTQADAHYIALQLLRNYPKLAEILVNRFPKFIIDEAQDTSEIHMAIIDILLDHGLKYLMLVGDPDQAIFEWNDAHPELFRQKYDLWRSNSVILNENRRSTQAICDFTFKLSSLEEKSIAISPELKNINYVPIICTYDENNVDATIQVFRNKCKEYGIPISQRTTAVLYRGNSFVSTIAKTQTVDYPWKGNLLTREIINSKYLFENGHIKKGFEQLSKVFVKTYYRVNSCTSHLLHEAYDEIGYRNLLEIIYRLLMEMPTTSGTPLIEWIKTYNRNRFLSAWNSISIDTSSETNGQYNIESYFSKDTVTDLYPDMKVGTIHSVKGETYEAVLIFLKQKAGSRHYYKTLLRKGNLYDFEEIRIVYVGITRPRKFLMLAVPEKDFDIWSKLI